MKIRLLLTILLLTATIAANTQIMERTFLKKVLTKLEKIDLRHITSLTKAGNLMIPPHYSVAKSLSLSQ